MLKDENEKEAGKDPRARYNLRQVTTKNSFLAFVPRRCCGFFAFDCSISSVTRFGEIQPLWQIIKNRWPHIQGLVGFGQSFQLTLA